MIPSKELNALASALMNSNEFKNVINSRKKIKSNPQLFKKAMDLENQKKKILSSNMQPAQKSQMIKKQIDSNKEFLDKIDIKKLSQSTEIFQKYFSECISYLNKKIDSQINR